MFPFDDVIMYLISQINYIISLVHIISRFWCSGYFLLNLACNLEQRYLVKKVTLKK